MAGASSLEVDDLFAIAREDKPACPALPKVGGVGFAGSDNRFVNIALGGPADKDVGAQAVYLHQPLAGTSAQVYWQLRHFHFKLHGPIYLHIWIWIRLV